MAYAEKTKVSPENSRAEIERTLSRYGADAFGYGYEAERAVVTFQAHGRMVRFTVHQPPLSDFTMFPGRAYRRRTPSQQKSAQEQAIRQRWRALALVVKAKLEAVESGVTTFEEEFLAHVLLPNGATVGAWAGDQLEEVYATGEMPTLLPGTRPELEVSNP